MPLKSGLFGLDASNVKKKTQACLIFYNFQTGKRLPLFKTSANS
jgi:hypothetical protein